MNIRYYVGFKGSISLPLLIILVLTALAVGIKLPHTFQTSTPPQKPSEECVLTPDPSVEVTYLGKTYQRIFSGAQVMRREVQVFHIKQDDVQKTVRDISGAEKKAYIPTGESTTWTPDSKNLLYVDVSANDSTQIDGFSPFDIYLKSGASIPDYIRSYCNSPAHLPVGIKTLYPSANGSNWPPASFNTDALTDWTDGTASTGKTRPAPNTIYYLYAYEGEDPSNPQIATFWDGDKFWPHAKLSVTQRGETRIYTMRWVLGALGQMVLQDADPSHVDHKTGYLYVTKQMIDIDTNYQFKPETANTQDLKQRQSLQLETFKFPQLPVWSWWSPECKPAVYLYSQTPIQVHVTVSPQGVLSYTKPQYPPGGWDVLASPSGEIFTGGQSYPYLYYEAKIQDAAIEKPKTGYVVDYDKLDDLYERILPQLGLSPNETKDFVSYWHGILPKSQYYFVGVMAERTIDRIEPLTINPKPATIIRVRLYFQPQNTRTTVEEPVLTTKARDGFTVVEWGGLVKRDKDHPFTCSQ